MNGYIDLNIYNDAFELALQIRKLTISLSNIDKFEVGSQIRRSSQSIKDNIAEGYGRRIYKSEFIRFLYFSYSSALEAKSQAEFIYRINNENKWFEVIDKIDFLAIKIFNFIKYVDKNYKDKKS